MRSSTNSFEQNTENWDLRQKYIELLKQNNLLKNNYKQLKEILNQLKSLNQNLRTKIAKYEKNDSTTKNEPISNTKLNTKLNIEDNFVKKEKDGKKGKKEQKRSKSFKNFSKQKNKNYRPLYRHFID